MCFLKGKKTSPVVIPPLPTLWKPTTLYQFTSQQVFAVCDSQVSDHLYMWDNTYMVISLEDMQRVIENTRQNLPTYTTELFDCEDFAFLLMTRITEKYQLNSLGVAVGTIPAGGHGFNIFVTWETDKLVPHILEPQTGEMDLANYKIDTAIFS